MINNQFTNMARKGLSALGADTPTQMPTQPKPQELWELGMNPQQDGFGNGSAAQPQMGQYPTGVSAKPSRAQQLLAMLRNPMWRRNFMRGRMQRGMPRLGGMQ